MEITPGGTQKMKVEDLKCCTKCPWCTSSGDYVKCPLCGAKLTSGIGIC